VRLQKITKIAKKEIAKEFSITDLGELNFILGIEKDLKAERIRLCQIEYTNKIIDKYGTKDMHTSKTPMPTDCIIKKYCGR
jgi:Reverse transcriptase (RNA-dependent DNA polymerase)